MPESFFEFWRPITAIRLADTDGNPDTSPQTNWTPLLTTPNYADYDSGHQSNAAPAAYILTAYFGSEMPVEGARIVPGSDPHLRELYGRCRRGVHVKNLGRDSLPDGP